MCRTCEGMGKIQHKGQLFNCNECRGSGLSNPPHTSHPGEGEEYVEERQDLGSVPSTGPSMTFQGRDVSGPQGGGTVIGQYDEEGNPTNLGIPFGGIFTRSADPLDEAWSVLKQYEPMRPLHRRSVMFPQMRSPTKIVENRQLGIDGLPIHTLGRHKGYWTHFGPKSKGYFTPYHEQDQEGPLHEVRFQHQRKGRNLTPDERAIRNTEDRNQAIDRANQFHQDRIDAMQNLPSPGPGSFSQPPNPDFNPFTVSGGQ